MAGRHFQTIETSSRRLEAPLFVQVDTAKNNTHVLSGGVPYHRRATPTQLDTILVTSGESARKFRLGLGVDLANPTHAALDWMAADNPPLLLDGGAKNESGWLFHVSAKNVLATSWQPLPAKNGLQMRLMETQGKRTRLRLQAFKPWAKMDRVAIDGGCLGSVEIKEGFAELTLSAHEIVELHGVYANA